jgi:hypothetical protein
MRFKEYLTEQKWASTSQVKQQEVVTEVEETTEIEETEDNKTSE